MKVVEIKVTKENESFLGGLYPAEAEQAAIEYLIKKGYTIVSVTRK